jgi:uncharacterized membrane protein
MTSIFEWLFKYRPLLYERGTIDFQPIWPSYVIWLLFGAAILGSYLLYRRSSGVLSNSWRYTLSALRASSFMVVVLIFLQPVLRLQTVIPQENFVAVAYDASKSMEIEDGVQGESRLKIEQDILRPVDNPLMRELASKFKLRFFRFSGSVDRTEAFEDAPRHGDITDLKRSLLQVSEELATVPLAGIVLITDGADNHSENLDEAINQLRARNIRVYSIGIGSENFSHDTEIVRVTAPKKVLKDAVMEAEVSVRSVGYPGRHTKLIVTDQGKQLQSRDIVLGSDGEVKTYKINLSAQVAGPRNLKFAVENLPGEIILENNDQTILVSVEDDQPQILYVEGEPRWEYGFLRRAILPDKNLRLVTLLRQADGKFYRQGIESPGILEKGFPVDKEELFKYKAIILGSIEASFFSFDQLRIISDFVSRRGGGFLMLGGRNSFGQGGYIHTPLEDLLPLHLAQSADTIPEFQDLEFKIHLTSYGMQHPICRLSLQESLNRKRWENAPDLIGFNPTSGPKPGATVLATGSSVQGNGGENYPILAFQRFGKGKSVAFTTASSWRWQMEQEYTDNFHELFCRQMLRWLVSDVSDPVSIETEKHSYSPDDIAVLSAEVSDPSFEPLNNIELSAEVTSPSGNISSVPLVWDVNKDGHYSGAFKPNEEGIHKVTCEAFRGKVSLGKAQAHFRIAESTEEFHDAALNSDLLRRLADETGGRYYKVNALQTLPEDISYIDKGAHRMEGKDLWDMPFLFLLLVGLISTEWVLRKRKGLV